MQEKNKKNFIPFGKRLYSVRQSTKLNQTQFAQLSGFSSAVIISRFERGERLPTSETLIKLVELFKVDINWLLTGDPASSFEYQTKSYKEAIERLLPFAVEYMATLGRKQIILQQEKRGLQGRSDRLSKNRLAAIDLELQNLNELVDAAEFEFHDATQLLKEKNGGDVSVYFGVNADEETKRSMKQSLKKTKESTD